MKMHFCAIPALGDAAAVDALNAFPGSHRISGVRRHFVEDGARTYWAVSVTYLDAEARPAATPVGKGRIDYRQVLSTHDFVIYAQLREVRKKLATDDAVPPYHVLTNEQLAEIVRARIATRQGLASLPGFGHARMAKYGDALLAAFSTAFS